MYVVIYKQDNRCVKLSLTAAYDMLHACLDPGFGHGEERLQWQQVPLVIFKLVLNCITFGKQ